MANGKLYTKIKVTDALKALGKQLDGVTVQVARPGKKKNDDGVMVDVNIVEDKPLTEALVLSAKKWKNGQITITTIDGRRYPAKADTAVDDEEDEAVSA